MPRILLIALLSAGCSLTSSRRQTHVTSMHVFDTFSRVQGHALIDPTTAGMSLGVRCVRGWPAIPADRGLRRFVEIDAVPAQVVVHDTVTGLYWQKIGQAGGTWNAADDYCDDGVGSWGRIPQGWRMPTIVEAISLVDLRTNEAGETAALSIPNPDVMWTSTPNRAQSGHVHVNLLSGVPTGGVNGGTAHARCVSEDAPLPL